MLLETLSYAHDTKWSSRLDGSLDSDDTLVVAFGAPSFSSDPAPFRELSEAYPKSHIVGCSTSGEIHDAKVVDDSISVAVARFERSTVRAAYAAVGSSEDSLRAGEEIAHALLSPELRGVLVLSDGLTVNGSRLVRGLNSVLPSSVVVTGGLAGDGDRFANTWVLKDRRCEAGVVSAIGFYGDAIRIGHGSRGGWDIFGMERRVTRSCGNVLYEIDGKPALELYKDYLGDRAAGLPATALLFPLALRQGALDAKQLVRTVLAVDEKQQSLTFAGDIPEGSLVQLMSANFDRLVQGASDAAQLSIGDKNPDPKLSIAISCVGRRLVLGERIEEEVEAVLEILPPGTKQIGFYSYGEISPFASGACDLHNQTMTLTTVSEA